MSLPELSEWDKDRLRTRIAEMKGEDWTPADCDTLRVRPSESEEVVEGDAERMVEAVNEALDGFVVPEGLKEYIDEVPSGKASVEDAIAGVYDCICCGARLNGFMGTFEWGMVNGEGKCGRCGYPHRAYHRIYIGDEKVGQLTVILPPHPSQIDFKEDSDG